MTAPKMALKATKHFTSIYMIYFLYNVSEVAEKKKEKKKKETKKVEVLLSVMLPKVKKQSNFSMARSFQTLPL